MLPLVEKHSHPAAPRGDPPRGRRRRMSPPTHQITEAEVRAALAEVGYPGLNRDIVSLGLVRSVAVRNGRVHVSLALSSTREEVPDLLRAAIRERLAAAGAVRSEVQILPPGRLPMAGGHAGAAARDPWADRGRLPGV